MTRCKSARVGWDCAWARKLTRWNVGACRTVHDRKLGKKCPFFLAPAPPTQATSTPAETKKHKAKLAKSTSRGKAAEASEAEKEAVSLAVASSPRDRTRLRADISCSPLAGSRRVAVNPRCAVTQGKAVQRVRQRGVRPRV